MSEPTPPPADDKDWTWVLSQPCPDCGFDSAGVELSAVPALTRTYAAALARALEGPLAADRPAPAVWSALEYACHVRDVCRIFDARLQLMLDEDDPLFDNWDQDATALEQRYWQQLPATVAGELVSAADTVADGFAGVRGEQWLRPGRRSNGSVFSVDTLARYFLHDLAHHASDVSPPP